MREHLDGLAGGGIDVCCDVDGLLGGVGVAGALEDLAVVEDLASHAALGEHAPHGLLDDPLGDALQIRGRQQSNSANHNNGSDHGLLQRKPEAPPSSSSRAGQPVTLGRAGKTSCCSHLLQLVESLNLPATWPALGVPEVCLLAVLLAADDNLSESY